MQKNAGKGFPKWIRRIELPKQDGTVLYPAVDDERGLAYLVNQNTITFHIPCFRASDLFHPDRLVLDLDPSEGDLEGVRLGAQAVRSLLAQWGVDSWPMTSGSKGFHVVAPLAPTVSFEDIGRFAQIVAVLLSQLHPERLTVEFLKKDRKGRVFIDWLRNGFGATGVAPYSLRPRPGAPLATPISWEELEEVKPDGFRLRGAADRLAAPDPWSGARPQDLTDPLAAAEQALVGHGLELPAFDRFGRG